MFTWILRTCAVLASLMSLGGAWDGRARDAAFADHGRRAVIDPVKGYTTTVTTTTKVGVEVNREARHQAFVTFRTAAGQRMQVSLALPDTLLPRLAAGESVLVEYLPETPEVARLVGSTSGAATLLMIGAAVTALTAVFWRRM